MRTSYIIALALSLSSIEARPTRFARRASQQDIDNGNAAKKLK